MNHLTSNEIREILRIIEESSFDVLEVTAGDLKIVAEKNTAEASPTVPVTSNTTLTSASSLGSAPDVTVALSTPSEPPPSAASEPISVVPVAPEKAEMSDDDNLYTIKSPIVGVFYATPEPDAPPFVEEGSIVDADSTVGLIEVMKVFNGVKAGVEGKIVRCLIGNNEFVEHGQPLFLVEPKAEGR